MKFLLFLIVCWTLNLSVESYSTYNINHAEKVITYKTDGNLQMILLGDWGGIPNAPNFTPYERSTARQIMRRSKEEKIDFVLALGDNMYFQGVKNEYDSRFQTTFEDVFYEEHFKTVPWFVIAGNHDHYGNISGEIEYSNHSKRWNFPSLWYTIKVKSPNFNATIIMIDTVLLCGNTRHDKYGDQPDEYFKDEVVISEQLKFIEKHLQNNNDSYLFVAGHFPIWSIAEHGPTECLLKTLRPLLRRYKASGYFCGHDHNLQHLKESDSNVEYILSGAGDMISPSVANADAVPEGSLMFHSSDLLSLGGYAAMKLNKENASFVFETGLGDTLYKYVFDNRLKLLK